MLLATPKQNPKLNTPQLANLIPITIQPLKKQNQDKPNRKETLHPPQTTIPLPIPHTKTRIRKKIPYPH